MAFHNPAPQLRPQAAFLLFTIISLGCSGDPNGTGENKPLSTGGSTTSSGGSASGGRSAGGGSNPGESGGRSTGGVGVGGSAQGGTSSAGMSSGGANSAGGGTSGETGGSTGSGGNAGTGGDGGSGGSQGIFTPSTGPERSMGYLGCSMSVNVAEGYEALGGERLWPPLGAYNGQVVQNWADNNDPVWGAFEDAVDQYGTPQDVWVMLCIFSNMVTVEEAEQIVANVRSRVSGANIYITGQPLYDDPNSCFLAGDGGPDKTDRIARETAADTSLDLIYPGALGPLASSASSDGCHTNEQGSLKLGEQFIDWFGE